MEALFWGSLSVLATLHIAMQIRQLSQLYRARKALSPDPKIMAGQCIYRLNHPPTGIADEMYCRNYRCAKVIESLETCHVCKKRVLQYEGAKYFEYSLFNSYCSCLATHALSLVIGLLPLCFSVTKLYLDLWGGTGL